MRPRKVVWRTALLAIAATVTVSGLPFVSAPASAAGPRPLFQLPVACNETWRLQTYAGHDDYDIDFFPTAGTTWGRPILASYGGVVDFAGIDGTLGSITPFNPNGQRGSGGGYMVGINHGNGWRTIYLHMLEWPMVAVGQTVSIGQKIGRVGSTGDSSGPHLHYEQLADGAKVESWFNGVPSGITHDNYGYSVERTSNNCSSRQVYEAADNNEWRPVALYGSGGPVTGADVAAIIVNGVRYVYTIKNGQVYEARNTNGWRPVALSGSGGPVTGSAVAAIALDGVRYVYTIKNGQVYEAAHTNDWRPLPVSGPGGAVVGSDLAAVVQGGVKFVYTTHHGQVYEASSANQWRPLPVSGPGGAVTGSVVAAIATKTVRYVYAIRNGQVYEAANDNGWRPLPVSGPGGAVTGSAVAAVTYAGVKYLYAL